METVGAVAGGMEGVEDVGLGGGEGWKDGGHEGSVWYVGGMSRGKFWFLEASEVEVVEGVRVVERIRARAADPHSHPKRWPCHPPSPSPTYCGRSASMHNSLSQPLPYPIGRDTILMVRVNSTRQGELDMAKSNGRNEVTSARTATAASKVLRDPRASAAAKSAAGSALTQRPGSATKKSGR